MKAPSKNFGRKSRQSRMSLVSQQDGMNLSDLGSILDGRENSLDNIDSNAKKDLIILENSFEIILNDLNRRNTVLAQKKVYLTEHHDSLTKLNAHYVTINQERQHYETEALITNDENELRDIEKRARYKTSYFSFKKEHIHEFLFSRKRQIKYFLDKLRLIYETEKSETKVLTQFQNGLFDQIVR